MHTHMKYVRTRPVFDENLALWHFYGCTCAPPTFTESAEEYDEVLRKGERRYFTPGHKTPIVNDLLLWLRAGGIMYDIYPWVELPEHPTQYEGDAPATRERRALYRNYLMDWFRSHEDYIKCTLSACG